jgi:hypothetical protein
MTGHIVPVPAGQAGATSLDELCARVRDAHSGINTAFSNAIDRAIDAGRALVAAHDLTPHGQWAKFLKRCDLGERQAQRYMRLARLLEENPTSKSDLTNRSIEAAIKKLSPPKAAKTASGGTPAKKTTIAHPNAAEIIAAWDGAPQDQRTEAFKSIGLEALWAALPLDWMPEIEKRLADSRSDCAPAVKTPACVIPDDGSIPEFMRRPSPNPADVTPAGPIAHSSNADTQ